MPGLFQRALNAKSRLLGTAVEAVPVPYEIPCDCGHRVVGIRRTRYVVANCSHCDAAIYVLPVNVYPTTRRIHSQVVDGSIANRFGTVMRELVRGTSQDIPEAGERLRAGSDENSSDEPRDANRSTPGQEETRRRAGTSETRRDRSARIRNTETERRESSRRPAADSSAPNVRASSEVPPVELPSKNRQIRVRRVFSVTRILALAVFSVVAVTVWWNVAQRQLEQARRTWRTEMDAAKLALKKGDFESLESSLNRAVIAGERLRKDDGEYHEAVSLLKQTRSVRELSSLDLVTLMLEATSGQHRFESTALSAAAKAMTGQNLLFETTVLSSDSTGKLILEFPLVVGDFPVTLEVSSDRLKRCAELPPSRPLLFTARIASCTAPAPEQAVWRIELDSDSCTLITTAFHAQQLGFDVISSPDLVVTLEKQANFLNPSVTETDTDSPTPL